MVELVILSLLAGSLGLLAASVASWRGWQQQKRQQQEEEEILTQYESKENLPSPDSQLQPTETVPQRLRSTGWEFKILRAKRDLFRNPETLKRVCDEEAEAGWILLEKLDERRLRFKRPMVLRDRLDPEQLNRDPYRSRYGSPVSLSTILGLLILVVTLVLPAYLGYALVTQTLSKQRPSSPPASDLQQPFSPPPSSPSPSSPSPSSGQESL